MRINPNATIIDAASPVTIDKPELIKGKQVLVVEDGPTLTHGEMKFGAGVVAAMKAGAAGFVDARPYAIGKLRNTYDTYPGIGVVLPAMGYGDEQIRDLEATIENTPCDAVVIGTPIDLSRVINIKKPFAKIGYDLQEIGYPDLTQVMDKFVNKFVTK